MIRGANEFIRELDNLEKAMKQIPTKVAAEAVLFSKERFQQQNWLDNAPQAWAKRKVERGSKRRQQRGVLTDSGRLRRGTRKVLANENRVLIANDVPYAEAHNEGLRVKGTAKVRGHYRGPYKRNGRTVKRHYVGKHTRKIDFQMPERRFIGESDALAERYEGIVIKEFETTFKGR